ncbi:MAG: GNAT family N-acetyltransferase [Candidatus Eisenbacteria bacterium]
MHEKRSASTPDSVFVTERLVVRRWRDTDLDSLLRIYGDDEAMRWVGDGVAITREQCLEWFEVTRRNYLDRGYGMFALELRGESDVIGFAGIVHPGGQAEAEVKYALARAHWGRGLATEVVIGLLSYGHRTHRLERIIATVAPENAASCRVLEKAGMRRIGLRGEGGEASLLFESAA